MPLVLLVLVLPQVVALPLVLPLLVLEVQPQLVVLSTRVPMPMPMDPLLGLPRMLAWSMRLAEEADLGKHKRMCSRQGMRQPLQLLELGAVAVGRGQQQQQQE